MTELCKSHDRVFLVRTLLRSLCKLLVFYVLGSSVFVLRAQTIEIKLLNGRNGRPMADTFVNVWVGSDRKDAMPIPTDKSGIARLRLTDNDSEIDIHNRGKSAAASELSTPVVKYDNSLRIHAGYVLCQLRKSDYSWLAITNFSTKQILQQGIVTANNCGKAKALPEPGELIIFVRPLSWWEKMKQ